MICPNCGRDCQDPSIRYCPSCGTGLTQNAFTVNPPKKSNFSTRIFPIVAVCAIAVIVVVFVTRGNGGSSSKDESPARTSTSTQAAAQPSPAVSSQPRPAATAQPSPAAAAPTCEIVDGKVYHEDNKYYGMGYMYAKFKNTSSYAVYVDCDSVDYEDGSGNLLGVDNIPAAFPPILEPGETGYIYSKKMFDDPLGDIELAFQDHTTIKKATVANVRLEVQDISFTSKKALGRIKNSTSEDQSLVYVSVALYHGDDCIGYFQTVITECRAGEVCSFETFIDVLQDGYETSDITSYEAYVYPYTMQW